MIILILSLAFALLVAIFALQNSAPVTIQFLWATLDVPLVLVILGSSLVGALIIFLLALWREFHYRRKTKADTPSATNELSTPIMETPETDHSQVKRDSLDNTSEAKDKKTL